MTGYRFSIASILAGAVLVAAGATADDHGRYGELEVEIDHLKAELRLSGDTWLVDTGYEVEVEGHPIPSGLALLLTVTDAERTIAAPTGEPIELIVPLDRPTDIDDDELEFKGAAVVPLPDGSFSHPANLRLHGYVVLPDADQPLVARTSKIDFFEYEPERVYHRSTHVGVSVGTVHRRTYVYRPPTIVTPRIVYRDYSYCRPTISRTRVIPYRSRVTYHRSVTRHTPVVRIERRPSVHVERRSTVRTSRTPVIRIKKKR
ncbi:MAG: hypothetical protein D6744_06685 [Planctomycetota bacterium]|nr:MAG: hypothetical protein D6744_06685 [Planctomycetota bacterium]